MILIVDSGSTSTDWVFVKTDEVQKSFKGPGFNPYYFKDENYLVKLEAEVSGEIHFPDVDTIYFYGSGCSSQTNCAIVKSSLWESFPNANIQLHHDLFGAAVALCGSKSGIACILGTGSNSCLWNGKEILENVPSIGYLLGDEGSGTYLGKLILSDILLGIAPDDITQDFYETYKLDFAGTLDLLYKQPKPNEFIAGISKFASKNRDNVWIVEMIKKNFNDFIDKQVLQYNGFENYEISFVGSVAHGFQDILMEVLKSRNLMPGKIIKSPVDELVRFHIGDGNT